MERAIRVLLADDHPVLREGIAAAIAQREDMQVVGEASNGVEAVDLCKQLNPDVIVLDIRMPMMDGVQVCKTVLAELPDTKVIVLTAYDGDDEIYRALHAGAAGYLLKDATKEAVLEGIKTVFDGHKLIPHDVAAKLAWRIRQSDLTARELQVVREIASGKSNQEIGAALFISEGTVKAHINSILNKLGVSDRTQAIVTAIQRGIVRVDECRL